VKGFAELRAVPFDDTDQVGADDLVRVLAPLADAAARQSGRDAADLVVRLEIEAIHQGRMWLTVGSRDGGETVLPAAAAAPVDHAEIADAVGAFAVRALNKLDQVVRELVGDHLAAGARLVVEVETAMIRLNLVRWGHALELLRADFTRESLPKEQ